MSEKISLDSSDLKCEILKWIRNTDDDRFHYSLESVVTKSALYG